MDDYKLFNEVYTRNGFKCELKKDEPLEILCDVKSVRLSNRYQLYLDVVYKRNKAKSFTEIPLLVSSKLYTHQFNPNYAIDGLIRVNELQQFELIGLFEETSELIYKVKYCVFCNSVYRSKLTNCPKCGCSIKTTNNIYENTIIKT